MAYQVGSLRSRNLFDQMTPSYGGGGQDVLDPMGQPLGGGGYQPYDPQVLDPMGQPLEPQQPTLAPPQVGADNRSTEIQNLINAINQVYTPDNTDRDRFRRLMDSFPGEYTPTRGDRWTAALMGLGAGGRQGGDSLKTMDYVLQGPRMRDIEEWKLKADPYSKGYQFENAANNIERQMAGNLVTGIYNQDKNRIAQERNQMYYDIQTVRNRIAALRAEGANVKVDFSGPTVLISRNGVIEDTGVETGKMREVDKINLQNIGRENAARVQGENAARTATIREGTTVQGANNELYRIEGTNKEPIAKVEGEQGPFTPIGGGGGPQGQLERDRVQNSRIEAWLRANPSKYDYVTEEETNRTGKNSLIGQNNVSNNYDMGPIPEPPPGKGWIESESAYSAKWQEYKERMARYNQLREKLFNLPPLPIKGTRAGGYTGANDPKKEGATTTATTTIPPTGPSSGPPNTGKVPPTTSSVPRTPGRVPPGYTAVYDTRTGEYRGFVPTSRLEEARRKGLTPR